jgi:hypothetical protein
MLDARDGATDGGLGESERFAGAHEAACLDHRAQQAQAIEGVAVESARPTFAHA